jgi:hypothetical protein
MAKAGTRSKRTTAVGANAPAASASLDETMPDREDGDDASDGSDMMVRGGSDVVAKQLTESIVDADESGLVEESGSGFAWSVPDSTPQLRRAATLDVTTSTEAFEAKLDVVATEAPVTSIRAAEDHDTRVIAIRKYRSAETIALVPPPVIPTQHTTPEGEAQAPEFMRPRMGADAADRDQFSQRREAQGVDPLTQRLGCKWFVDGARFDWCREGSMNLNPSGELDSRNRHVFTRWYQMDRIIVDVFRNDSDRVRREIAEKIAAIEAHAKKDGVRLGYLPCVRGAFVPDEVIAAVKRGEIVPFQLAQMRTSEVVAAFG